MLNGLEYFDRERTGASLGLSVQEYTPVHSSCLFHSFTFVIQEYPAASFISRCSDKSSITDNGPFVSYSGHWDSCSPLRRCAGGLNCDWEISSRLC